MSEYRQPDRPQPQLLAEHAGTALYQLDDELYLLQRGTGWTLVVTFVLGLIIFILGINGVVQIALSFAGEGHLVAGLILAAVGALAGTALYFVRRFVRTRAGFRPDRVMLVMDLMKGELRTGTGRQLAMLNQVRFFTAFQFTSSARSVRAQWPGTTVTIVRGNALGGSAQDILDKLRERGLQVE